MKLLIRVTCLLIGVAAIVAAGAATSGAESPSARDSGAAAAASPAKSVAEEPRGFWSASAEVIKALAWPVAALVGAILLREPLIALVGELSRRGGKISFMEFSVEFRPLQEAAAPTEVMNLKVTEPVPVTDSYAATLVEQIQQITRGHYAVADLGSGNRWLTSRLFIFAVMLERMSSLNYFVFQATRGMPGVYVGIAPLKGVRWALARRYPWLEQAYARAYADVFGPAPGPPLAVITSLDGKFERPVGGYPAAADVIRQFLQNIQQPVQGPEPDLWQPIRLDPPLVGAPSWEHASWLDEALLRAVLKDVMVDEDAAVEFSAGASRTERKLSVLRAPGDVVAVIARSGRLKCVIDRRGLLEDLAKREAEPQARAADDRSAGG